MTTQNGTVGASYELNPDQLAQALKACFAAKRNVMVWGSPGISKSAVAAQVTASLGYRYGDVRAPNLDAVDIRGLPYRDEETGVMRWAVPSFLPPMDTKEWWVLNFEELPAAPQLTQVALYQLLQERRIGEYVLPDTVLMMACGNKITDSAASSRMNTALASRFYHIDVKPDVSQWLEWASDNDIAPEVMFFMHFRPDLFHDFDPVEIRKSEEHTFPCPRTWEYASDYVKTGIQVDTEVERSLMRGCIGAKAAVEFCAFLRMWRSLTHPRAILAAPDSAPMPDNQSALIATCGALYRLADDTNMDAIVTFASRGDMRREVGTFLVDRCIKADPELMHTQAYIRWTSEANQ